MRENHLNIVQELLLKKRLRDKLLLEASEARKKRPPQPTFIYSGFKRIWHVVFD